MIAGGNFSHRSTIMTKIGPTPVSAAAAVSGIQSGERVFAGGFAATPTHLLAALAARGPELRGVRVAHLILLGGEDSVQFCCGIAAAVRLYRRQSSGRGSPL
jgi:hypothetical protein